MKKIIISMFVALAMFSYTNDLYAGAKKPTNEQLKEAKDLSLANN